MTGWDQATADALGVPLHEGAPEGVQAVWEPPVLTDLAARAVADESVDREAWLAARRGDDGRGAVTATEARDLWLGKVTPIGLAQKKRAAAARAAQGLESERSLGRVKVIAWGRARELVHAERLRGQGIRPESRVFHHAHDSRKLASPDGLGVDFDERLELSEIKTGDTEFYGHEGMLKKGYHAQQVWGMDVLGAWRSKYVFEERVEGPDGYQPGRVYEEWVVLDDWRELLAEMHALADETLRLLADADALPNVDEAIDAAAVNYLYALEQEKVLTERAREAQEAKRAATAAKVAAFEEVRSLAGSGAFQQESLLARVTKRPDEEVVEEQRVYDDARPSVVRAKATLERAQARYEALRDRWSRVEEVPVVKKGGLTITSPQKRKSAMEPKKGGSK